MAVVSAAEANRSFSQVLREVAAGETFTVLSRGRPVATISPVVLELEAYRAPRRALLARLASRPVVEQPCIWTRDELYD
jgi:prevent-host-death family protein